MSDQNQPQDPQGNGPNPWVKSLMVWGGVFLALLDVAPPVDSRRKRAMVSCKYR